VRSVVLAAVLVGLFAGAERLVSVSRRAPQRTVDDAGKERKLTVRAPCPKRAIPEGDVCIPLPEDRTADAASDGAPLELIPRLPDRPADVSLLALPIASPSRVRFDPEPILLGTHRARFLHVATERAAPVHAPSLTGQLGDADVLYVGDFVGRTVVTLHRTTDAGRARDYLVFFMDLDGVGPEVGQGRTVRADDVLGFAGDGLSPGEPHLLLEVRQVRDDIDVRPLDVEKMADASASIAVDPRNVFPERATP
jgi:hypothetical protein